MSLLSSLLFPVPTPSYTMHSFPNELLWIPWGLDYGACKPGDSMPAVFLQCPNARYLVLYLHSNGEDVGLCHPFGCKLRLVLEVHVLLAEYPGYGLCPGVSSEETLWRAADTAFRFISEVLHWPPEDVIVMGRSLGAALATRLATRYACHGLILVAPFLSLVEAVGQYVGGRLAKAFVSDIFSNRDRMSGVKVPVMVIHGKQDRLVACSQGRQLFDLCPHARKMLVTPEAMGHNCDLLGNPEFLVWPMLQFFSLPDYNFDDLPVPPEAFDKRLCLEYHNIVELTRCDAPMHRLDGDHEPCSPHARSGPFSGPQSQLQHFVGSNGDVDDLSGSVDFTVYERGAELSGRGGLTPAAGSSGLLGTALAAAADLDSTSTTAPSSSPPTKPSESLSGREATFEDPPNLSLPGLHFLDIDSGILRFLSEASGHDAIIEGL